MSELDLLRETFADYCKLRQTLSDLPEMSIVAVRRKPEQVAADEKLFERVTKVLAEQGSVGWARYRSELGWSGGHPPPCFKESGPPIMAEWLDRDGTAHRLTPASSVTGKALIVAIRDRELGSNDDLGEGEVSALRQCLRVLADRRIEPFSHIAYEVYWGLPENGSPSATRRLFDRFAGFCKQVGG